MAVGSLLVLLDDIAAIMDDVAAMTKVAANKTAGVLGDDLAVNAEKVTGVRPDRELPVVWAVAKGSFVNKLILVPMALLISALVPWLITPLLVCGGLYLCFEGAEKLFHWNASKHDSASAERHLKQLADPNADLAVLEKQKIRGAITTDFILSAEIIVLTLGVVEGADFITQLVVLAGTASLMTAGVYGLVAIIVKIDDVGLHFAEIQRSGMTGGLIRWVGRCLLAFAPWLMKALSVVGTVAMFLVGGGILLHAAHPADHYLSELVANVGAFSSLLKGAAGGFIGLVAGLLLVKLLDPIERHLKRSKQ